MKSGRAVGTLLALSAVPLLVVLSVSWTVKQSSPVTGVVIVTLDTTRLDRLSPYGFMDVRMRNLERLAAEGVVFDQAVTVAPLTLPAHASLFTGLLPPAHGVRDNADRPLSDDVETLAEALRARGFATGAFVGSVVLQADRGLSQGFDVYRDVRASESRRERHQRRGDAVVNDAIEWLEEAQQSSFLLWTHLYDPHAPYDPPETFRRLHSDPYVGELLFVDAQLGRLLDALDRFDLSDRSMVIVLADHGEGLGDHGEQTHGLRLYDTVLRIPLIVRLPAVQPRRHAGLVRIVDITPTVLDALGVDDGRKRDGASLLSALDGHAVDVDAYAESLYPVRMGGASLRAMRDGRYKLIDGPQPELYDLHTDPFEVRNIASAKPQITQSMRRRLESVSGPAAPSFGRGEVPAELRQRLDALGYIGGGPPVRFQCSAGC